MSTFQIFDKENDVVENQRTTISSGLWTGGSGTLTAAYTQSTNGNITGSFLDIYNEDPNLSSSAEVQYAVGYAHFDGSGSLSGGLSPNPRSADAFDNRPQAFYNSIESGSYFAARREEEISSTNYFVRVNNKRFNFSSNPTFATGSDGSLTQATFFKDPKTFITQVGLYNNENELLAIAKLSQPLLKSYSREAIIKVKLDF